MPKHGAINLYVHGNQKARLGRTAQDVHLDSHTAPELWNDSHTDETNGLNWDDSIYRSAMACSSHSPIQSYKTQRNVN